MTLRVSGISLCVVSWFLSACMPEPQTHPLQTKPIPQDARILDSCSPLGIMLCGTVSHLADEAGYERRSACMAYIERSGRRVEQCGSIPISQP